MTPPNHLDVAEIFLQDSREALDRKALRTALSRAYYAAYHACVALFEYYGYRPQNFVGRRGRSAARWEHGIIIRRLLIEFTERGKFSAPKQAGAYAGYTRTVLWPIMKLGSR